MLNWNSCQCIGKNSSLNKKEVCLTWWKNVVKNRFRACKTTKIKIENFFFLVWSSNPFKPKFSMLLQKVAIVYFCGVQIIIYASLDEICCILSLFQSIFHFVRHKQNFRFKSDFKRLIFFIEFVFVFSEPVLLQFIYQLRTMNSQLLHFLTLSSIIIVRMWLLHQKVVFGRIARKKSLHTLAGEK